MAERYEEDAFVRRILSLPGILALWVLGVQSATAAPILYRTTYTATLGPSGTGSFVFDNAPGTITNFVWDFGAGIVGGVPTYDTSDAFGDTRGRFAFEILSETNVHSGIDCINVACEVAAVILQGVGPGGGIQFNIFGTPAAGSSYYEFRIGGPNFDIVDSGTISIAAVPEPTTFPLLGLGVFGIVLIRRKLRGYAEITSHCSD
jgi:hypothetical protein